MQRGLKAACNSANVLNTDTSGAVPKGVDYGEGFFRNCVMFRDSRTEADFPAGSVEAR